MMTGKDDDGKEEYCEKMKEEVQEGDNRLLDEA